MKHDLPQAPLVSALLWTTHLAYFLAAWRRRYGAELGRWLAGGGHPLRGSASLAAYAFENPGRPVPRGRRGRARFEADGLGHPLLPLRRCVRNDVRSGGDLRVLVVSGSNMSGKSTLLRAVGVNAVLALAGGPVRARRLRLSPLAVGATLRVQDSLQAGRRASTPRSLRVRGSVGDWPRGPRPLLFLLDELFARHQLARPPARRRGGRRARWSTRAPIGLVTTHDLALTERRRAARSAARNVHFADHFATAAPSRSTTACGPASCRTATPWPSCAPAGIAV